MAELDMKLKLFIDTEAKKVLFAEAGKDIVDYLFYLLSLPVGTVVRLLKEKGVVGCLADLYESFENLDQTFIKSGKDKDFLISPRALFNPAEIPLLLSDLKSRKVYMCSGLCNGKMSYVPNTFCNDCKKYANIEIPDVAAHVAWRTKNAGRGFVKGVVTYIVMDNLEVKPMSANTFITLLNKLGVKEPDDLEGRVVELGVDEGLQLLKASMESKTVLTSVFLGNTGA
ncbi:hypothetical protein LWI29_014297 [Acer saccharum]|uniref:DUF674 domain-containing protein n=2 Tax=Acer TaxID=4022 RepID=A0A5C7GY52_9ROSI|nr:hypothetical protein LWI29_014297 [Acer saccharum]TXG49683.1 hypothetical protein EZV62_025558 [Acer yangbiense]